MQICGGVVGGFQILVSSIPTTNACFSSSLHSPALWDNSLRKWNANANENAYNDGVRQCNVKQRGRTGTVWASLGFTPDRSVGAERAANELLRDASMLLVYQDIFKKPAAKAFLEVLRAIRARADGTTLFRLYGEFFKLMATSCYPSWQDFVLDNILAGEGNPFAKAAANVGNPQSVWSIGIPKSLRLAAATDLDSLQKLSITESTLTGWVADIVSDVRPDWRVAAASNMSSCNVVSAYSSSSENSFRHFADSLDAQAGIHADEMTTVPNAEASELQKEVRAKSIGNNDIIDIDREMWRKKIGGLWSWSEAVPLLEDYYAIHSCGRVASAHEFRWQQGKLMRDLNCFLRRKSICDLSHQKSQFETLKRNFRKHASRLPAQHVLVCGPSGIGKTQLMKALLYDFSQKGELRIILFPTNELKTLHELLEELAQHWQLRFIVFIDDLNLKVGYEDIRFVKSAIDRTSQDWPSNILLCGTSSQCLSLENGTLSFVNFRQIFGTVLELKDLSLEEYLLCVEELLHVRKKLLPSLTVNVSDVSKRAKEWVQNQNAYTVQDASQCVSHIFQHD